MVIMEETIKKVDEILERFETVYAAYMRGLLMKARDYLTKDSLKVLFECGICQETKIEVEIVNVHYNILEQHNKFESLIFFQSTFMNCKHSFCNFCLLKWHKLNLNCPVCRKDATMADKNKLVDGVIDVLVELSFSDEQKKERDIEIQQRRVPVTTEEPSELSDDEASESSSDDDSAETLEFGLDDDAAVMVVLKNVADHFRRNQRISCVRQGIALFAEFGREILKYSSPEESMGPKEVKPDDDIKSPQDLPSFSDITDRFRDDYRLFRSISELYQSEYMLSIGVSSNSEA